MKKAIYIDGNLLVKKGVFHGLNFIMYSGDKNKEEYDDIISCNKDGIYEVTEDGGSMFTTYYVKGGITTYGGNGSTIVWFKKEHEQTFSKYKDIQRKILLLLEEAIIPEDCKNYFYQQQYISLFANLEYFLYGTFIWETCQCYESYDKVLKAHLSFLEYKEAKHILRGEHCILQEMTFVEQAKHAVYHNTNQVSKLYENAFGITIDLDSFKKERDIRHDIVHRAGYTINGFFVQITKKDVIALKDKIDKLVEDITLKIKQRNK